MHDSILKPVQMDITPNIAGSCCFCRCWMVKNGICVQTDATTPKNVRGHAVYYGKDMTHKTYKIHRPSHFQHVNELLSPWRPRVMCVCGPNNVGRAVHADPTLLCYASAIKEQKKNNVGSCWFKSLTSLKRCATTTPNNIQHGVQMDATRNTQQCWQLLANNVASICTGLKA